jgi:PAS domain S-box-containing protein
VIEPAGHWPHRRLAGELALAFALSLLLALGAIAVSRLPGTVAVVWLANGLAIALLASAPRAHVVPLLVACGAGHMGANLLSGDTLAVALGFLLPNALEIALGGWLLRQGRRAERLLQGHQGFLEALAFGALLPPLAGATVGASVLQALGFGSFERVWLDWYIGAALGAVVMLPLVLSLRGAPAASAARLSEPASLLVLLLIVAVTVAAVRLSPYPFVVIAVALSLVAFARPRVVVFACAPPVVMALAVELAFGNFAPTTPDTPTGHAVLFASALLAVMPPLALAVVLSNQRALADMLAAVGSRDDDIIVIADREGRYRWVNRARERYHGQPAAAVLGRTVGEIAAGRDDRQALVDAFDRAMAGETVRARTEVKYAVMGTRIMDLRVQPAHDAEGHLAGVLFSAGDVTELEASRRELEQFVRIASHDLREPLNTVLQFAQLIETGPAQALGTDGRLYLKQVHEGAARLKRMLDDLLQYVRLEGAGAAEPEAVPLDLVFEEVQASLQAQLQASGGELRCAGPLGEVYGHPALLTLALQNLVSNALKFVAPGGQPRVEVQAARDRDQTWLRLTVADQGIGIEPARVGQLGQPFKRLHARRKYDGTGLGLAIVRRIAERHGGRLEIESTPGAGSRFTLVLPAALPPD